LTIQKQYFTILCLTLLISILSFFRLLHQRQCYERIYWFKDLIATLSAELKGVELCEENDIQLSLVLEGQEAYILRFTYTIKADYQITVTQADQKRFQAQAPHPYFISSPDLIGQLKTALSKESTK
jgi:hypothetical protein